jgi:hypothetical protein
MTTFNFPPTSRYYGIETVTVQLTSTSSITYLRRRFLPPPEAFALLKEHVVVDGERLDQIAAQELGDAEAFWRIADANAAMRPEALTETPGRRLRITLPQGIPGSNGAPGGFNA